MSKIKFIYEKNIFEMMLEDKDSIGDIIKKYVKLLSVKIEDLLFLYKGINIKTENNEKLKLKKNKNMTILVFKLNKDKKDIKEIKNIICPECKNLAIININEDNINIENCKNKHKNKYSINEFIESQNNQNNEEINVIYVKIINIYIIIIFTFVHVKRIFVNYV